MSRPVAGLAARILRTTREHALLGPADRVGVAVSGGADSVALLWLLRDLILAGNLPGQLAGLIHVNHGLRGAEAARDEEFCRNLADRVSLPLELAHADAAAAARATRRSIEAAARDLRYQFFAEAAARLGATVVATGHTLDDQAETVLLRLLRGAGTRGLTGIRIRRGLFIRPLLDCRRAQIRQYLAAKNEPFCEDSSNASLTIARNRIRHQLLPVLEQIAPGGLPSLARLAALAGDDEASFEFRVTELSQAAIRMTPAGVQVDTARLAAQPTAIARRLIRRAIELVDSSRASGARHLDSVLRLARSPRAGGRLSLPGVSVEHRGDALFIAPASEHRCKARSAFEVPLPVPGEVALPDTGLSVTAFDWREGAPDHRQTGGDTAVVQAEALTLPLVVRSRRPGDRLRPLGAPGRRKLQDLLVDRKVPRAERDAVPLVVDATGEIVWVAGVTIAEPYRVTAPSAGMVVLKVQKRNPS